MAIAYERAEVISKLNDFDKTGPLGSIEKHQFLDVAEVHELLNRPHSVLADLWKKDRIYAWARSLDRKMPNYEPSETTKNLIWE